MAEPTMDNLMLEATPSCPPTEEDAELLIEATPELFAHIIEHMNNWREIAPHLGLTPADRELVEEKSDLSQQRLYMLEKWKEKLGREATFSKLAEAFRRATRQDLAEKVCQFFKDNQPGQRDKRAVNSPSSYRTPIDDEGSIHGQTVTVNSSNERSSREVFHQTVLESRQVITQRPSQTTAAYSLCYIAVCILIPLIICGSITFLAISTTLYRETTPPTGDVVVRRDRAVLLGEFDPFYVANVECTSDNTNTFFHRLNCQMVPVRNQTVHQLDNFNVTQKQNYRLYEKYLVKGSQLDFNFTLHTAYNTTTNNTQNGQRCLAVIHEFENISAYINFLTMKITPATTNQPCLPDKYSLKADETRYYLIGLHLPDPSTLETVEFETIGYELYYDLSHHQADCAPVNLQPSCKFELGRAHFKNSNVKTCILASTTRGSVQVEYQATHHDVLGTIHTVLLVLGCLGVATAVIITVGLLLSFRLIL